MILVLFLHKHCILCIPFKFMWCKVEGAPSPHSHNNGDGHMVSTTTTSDDASLPLFPPPHPASSRCPPAELVVAQKLLEHRRHTGQQSAVRASPRTNPSLRHLHHHHWGSARGRTSCQRSKSFTARSQRRDIIPRMFMSSSFFPKSRH